MNTPRFKDPTRDAPQEPRATLFGTLQSLLRVDSIVSSGLPVRYLPRLLWLTVLIIFYIANNHSANRTIVRTERMKAETEELRVVYTTMKAEYMSASKQSEVARRVERLGIYESQVPPRKIVLRDGE
jgi:Bacteriodetes cell division protein (FtsL-like)